MDIKTWDWAIYTVEQDFVWQKLYLRLVSSSSGREMVIRMARCQMYAGRFG